MKKQINGTSESTKTPSKPEEILKDPPVCKDVDEAMVNLQNVANALLASNNSLAAQLKTAGSRRSAKLPPVPTPKVEQNNYALFCSRWDWNWVVPPPDLKDVPANQSTAPQKPPTAR